MKAIILARVSTKEQEDGHSLDAQIQSCFEYAIKKNLQVIEQFKIVESSKAIGRPEFTKMINFVKNCKHEINIICYCVDRLQRDFDEQYIELQKLINKGAVIIHYAKDEFIEHKDMNSGDKFIKNLNVILANDYRNRISDNVKRSNKKKLAEGSILGNSPLGYLNTKRFEKKESAEVYIDPVRGDLIKQAFEKYATGLYSMNEIYIDLTTQGLTSKKGFKVAKSQIENILKNPFYYGYMKYNNMLYKHTYPTLISKELFDECQNVRLGKTKNKYKRTEKPFILKGLLRCQHCKCAYSPEIKKGKYIYMRPTKSKGECSYCFHLTEGKILTQIEKIISGMHIPKHILIEINEELKKSSEKEYQHQIQESNNLQTQYTAVQTRIKKARELLLDMVISKDDYNDLMTDLQAQRHNIEVKLQRLSNADDNFNKSISAIFSIASKAVFLFKSSELQEKRDIISILFTNLEINGENLIFTTRKPFDMLLNSDKCLDWHPKDESNVRPTP